MPNIQDTIFFPFTLKELYNMASWQNWLTIICEYYLYDIQYQDTPKRYYRIKINIFKLLNLFEKLNCCVEKILDLITKQKKSYFLLIKLLKWFYVTCLEWIFFLWVVL